MKIHEILSLSSQHFTEFTRRRLINTPQQPVRTTFANHYIYYPTPVNLPYNWSYGSLLGVFFVFQIISGVFLAMHYTPHTDLAFASVEHIMTDVTGGYTFRYIHANGASIIFILLYLHIARGLYYRSYVEAVRLWYTGLAIFILMMATAFIGYVLPWGQMSFWGATVITSLVTAVPLVGEDIAYWVWGGFSISNATLTRFFSLHYLLPFVIVGIICAHLVALHAKGSTNPATHMQSPNKLAFHPYFTIKDIFILLCVICLMWILIYYGPNKLGHSDNFIPANPLVTPAHIVPEWYFTPFYAILRACPNKIGGAIGMLASLLILFTLPLTATGTLKPQKNPSVYLHSYDATYQFFFASFVAVFLTLMYLGMCPASEPYVFSSKIFTVFYFVYFCIVIPFLAAIVHNDPAVTGPSLLDDGNFPSKTKTRINSVSGPKRCFHHFGRCSSYKPPVSYDGPGGSFGCACEYALKSALEKKTPAAKQPLDPKPLAEDNTLYKPDDYLERALRHIKALSDYTNYRERLSEKRKRVFDYCHYKHYRYCIQRGYPSEDNNWWAFVNTFDYYKGEIDTWIKRQKRNRKICREQKK